MGVMSECVLFEAAAVFDIEAPGAVLSSGPPALLLPLLDFDSWACAV